MTNPMKPASRKRVRRPLNDQAFLDKVLKEKKPRVKKPGSWGKDFGSYPEYEVDKHGVWVGIEVMTPRRARKLAAWLLKAADYLDQKGPK